MRKIFRKIASWNICSVLLFLAVENTHVSNMIKILFSEISMCTQTTFQKSVRQMHMKQRVKMSRHLWNVRIYCVQQEKLDIWEQWSVMWQSLLIGRIKISNWIILYTSCFQIAGFFSHRRGYWKTSIGDCTRLKSQHNSYHSHQQASKRNKKMFLEVSTKY